MLRDLMRRRRAPQENFLGAAILTVCFLTLFSGGCVTNETDQISILLGDLKADSPAVREEAAQRLGNLSDVLQETGRTAKAANALRGMINDPVFEVRLAGAAALVGIGMHEEDAIPVLMDALGGSDLPNARSALRALSYMVMARAAGDAQATSASIAAAALVKGLESDHLEVQEAATAILRAMKDLDAATMTPLLLGIVRDGAPSARRLSIDVLGHLGEAADEAVPVLVDLLGDGQQDKELLACVARALGEMGPRAAVAVPALTGLLDTEDFRMRTIVVQALGDIGPAAAEAVPALAAAVEDVELRLRAIRALGQIGPSAAPAIDELLRAARNGDDETRLAAVVSFGQIGPAAGPSVPFLAEMVTTEDQDLRLAAIGSLGQIGSESRPAVAALTNALGSKDQETVKEAVSSLGKIGSAATDAVPALLSLLGAEDEWTRWLTIKTLGEIGEGAELAVPSLIELLSKKDLVVVGDAGRALAKIGTPAIPLLQEALRTDNEQLQEHAAWTLGMIGPGAESARNDLLKVFQEGSGDARWAAAAALARIGFKDDVLPHVLAATRQEDPKVRSSAVRAVGEMGAAGASAVPRLIQVLQEDEDSWVRVESARAMGGVGAADPSVVPALIKALLKDKDWGVRRASASALGEIGPAAEEALPALRKVVEEHSEASGAAAIAVSRITTGGPGIEY